MGCDIHLHIEVMLGGVWHHWSTPHISRYYDLFEKMAGVRGKTSNALAPPRGLPHDVTVLTMYCYEQENGDAHTMSWLGAKEIADLYDWFEQKYGEPFESILHCYLLGSGLESVWKYPEDREFDDVRFIFWFDN